MVAELIEGDQLFDLAGTDQHPQGYAMTRADHKEEGLGWTRGLDWRQAGFGHPIANIWLLDSR